MSAAYVVGVGMTRFEKPGRVEWDYPDMGAAAAREALEDAGIGYDEVQVAVASYVFGDSCSGQRALYELGLTGIPVYNVNNNCASGSTALVLARQLVAGGQADVVLAVGFERMQRGSLALGWTDRAAPIDRHLASARAGHPPSDAPFAPAMFANAAAEHMQRYGSTPEHFAAVAVKNHRHSVNNPLAQFQQEYTLEQVLAAPQVDGVLTRLQCSPTSDGGAAAVVMSARAVERLGLAHQAVEIAGQAMRTDTAFSSAICAVGYDISRAAAQAAYAEAKMSPEDVQVVELHDCFSVNEILSYEALGLAPEGKGHLLVEEGETTYGGRWVVNPSGGLISKGHPLGATGLAQCAELCRQLRGLAAARQVEGAQVGLAHNAGLGGAAVVTLYLAPAAGSSSISRSL